MSGKNWSAPRKIHTEDISSPINIPLPMDYYNLVDAVRLAKLKFNIPNFTPKLVVYYATKASINLFTPVQNSLEFTLVDTLSKSNSIASSLNLHPQNPPHFLVLSMAACLDFVANGKTKQCKFPTGYTYYNCKLELINTKSNCEWQIVCDNPSMPHPMDAAEGGKKNASVQNLASQTKIDTNSKSIPPDPLLENNDASKRTKREKGDQKTIALNENNILISHDALHWLIPVIEDELKRNEVHNKQHNPQEFINSDPENKNTFACYSLTVAASKTPDCKPLDLLGRAIRRNIALLTIVPDGIDVRSSNVVDNFTGEEFQRKPQLLALNKTDCEQIYNNQICEEKNVFKYDFTEGYIIDSFGHVHRVLPTDERPSLASEWISWRTFHGLAIRGLELTSESLCVRHSDLSRLTDPEPQDFDLPRRTKEFLLPKDYPSLKKAVELAKLKHPECTPNHLLIFGKLKLLDFITPVPVGIELHTCRIRKRDAMSGRSDKNAPELLVLSHSNCEDIKHNGSVKENGFFVGYSIFNGQLKVKHSSDVEGGWWWLTYYKGKLHEIELTPDRLYVKRDNLDLIIDADKSQWELVGNLVEENEAKKLILTEANNQKGSTETLIAESGNAGTKVNQETPDGIIAANEQQKKDQNEDQSESMVDLDWVLMEEVEKIVGFKSRKIKSLIAVNKFPKGTIKKGKNNWKRPEILAWYEANKFESVITGKRKPKAIIAVEKDPVLTEGLSPEVPK